MTFKTGSINIEGFSDFPKYLATGLLLCIICILVLSSVSDDSDAEIGEEFTVNHIIYTVTSDDTVYEVEVTGHDGSITEYNGVSTVTYNDKTYNVTSIGIGAFKNCTSLISVIIPENVGFIGKYAFENCTGLRELSVPISFDMSSSKVWKNVKNIEKVTFTPGNGIGYDYDDDSNTPWRMSKNTFTAAIFKEGITHIGKYILHECKKVTSVDLPNSLKSIGKGAFEDCSSLASIELPDGLTDLDTHVFKNCTSLNVLSIPDNIRSIGDYAFENCTGLKELFVPIGLDFVSSKYVWKGVKNVEKVTFTRGIDGIGYDYKGRLSTAGHEYRKTPWFMSRDNFTTVVFEQGIEYIGDCMFKGCRNLISVIIPEGVKCIGKGTFVNCSSLSSVVIPNTMTELKPRAFGLCPAIKELTVPITLNLVGTHSSAPSFGNSNQLEKIIFTKGTDGKGVDYNLDPKGSGTDTNSYLLTPIYKSTSTLTTAIFEEGITYIGSNTLFCCHLVTTLKISDTVTSVGDAAFQKCYGIKELTLPITLNAVGNNKNPIFTDCAEIQKVIFTKGTDGHGFDYGLKNKSDSYCHEFTPWYVSRNTLTTTVFEEGIEHIGKCTFKGCKTLTSVTFPESLRSIDDYAFNGCKSLESITLPNGLESVGEHAFEGCGALQC